MWYVDIDAHGGVGGGGRKSTYVSHKNAKKHEKGTLIRFSDKPKDPPKNNLAKTPLGFPATVHLCM